MAATTTGLSSWYVTPYHLSGLCSTFTRALPSPTSWLTTLGRKYSPFSGFVCSASSKKAAKRAFASGKKLCVKPHMFIETMVLPGSSCQVAPPSSV